jgi:hypothetical protein
MDDLRPAQLPEPNQVFITVAVALSGLPKPEHAVHLFATIF